MIQKKSQKQQLPAQVDTFQTEISKSDNFHNVRAMQVQNGEFSLQLPDILYAFI